MTRLSDFSIELPDLGPSIAAYIENLGHDISKQSKFINDPAGQISENFPQFGLTLGRPILSRGNQFLRSALSNDSFRTWAAEYQKDIVFRLGTAPIADLTGVVNRTTIITDISRALKEASDVQLIADWSNLLIESERNDASTVVSDEIAIVTALVVVLIVAITAIDVTPFTGSPESETLSSKDIRSLADSLAYLAKRDDV